MSSCYHSCKVLLIKICGPKFSEICTRIWRTSLEGALHRRTPRELLGSHLTVISITGGWRKYSRANGQRLVMQPWFTTGRPPVKFRTIWTSFDTTTVNTGTEKTVCVLQPNTFPKWPKTHLNLLHHLGHSITIAWPKTAPHLDFPSSSYLYK